jgi:type I restriction enzyme S subunit
MREKWAYKELGEVCDLYQPKTISSDMLVSDGDYLVYGANGIIGRYNQYNHEASEVLVTCRGATCGTINISTPFSWINGNAMVVHPKSEDLCKRYLVYALRGIDMSDVITGAAQPQITRQSLSPKKLPVPPISEQQRIVSELDLLSGIIEKKKAQLKEYDQLAQSIFYDMFGDPESNNLNWDYEIIGNRVKVRGGFAFKSSNYTTSGVRLVQIANVWKDKLTWDETTYISKENAVENSGFLLNKGDILMAMTRPIIKSLEAVKIAIVKEEDLPCILNQRVCKFEITNGLNTIWFYYFLRQPFVKNKISSFSSKGMQPNVSSREIESIPLILPPLSLQQSFAEKIEAIEKQKSLVQQSIVQTQTMFDFTMDKYFG